MESVRCVVGRLVEVRTAEDYRLEEDVDRVSDAVLAASAACISGRPVLVVDWRRTHILSEAVAARFRSRMLRMNPMSATIGMLFDEGAASLLLQARRLVRESQNARRQVFTSTESLVRWLGPSLDPAERARLYAFLAEPSRPLTLPPGSQSRLRERRAGSVAPARLDDAPSTPAPRARHAG